MPRPAGHRLPSVIRRDGIETMKGLLAAGVTDIDASIQVAKRFNVTRRTVYSWLQIGYTEIAKDVHEDRDKLLGLALRRRRIVMARSAKLGDWRTFLQAADSEARLLGLDAPRQSEHHVVLSKVNDVTKVMVDVIRDHFADDPEGQARFVNALQERLSVTIAARSDKKPVVIEVAAGDSSPTVTGQEIAPGDEAPFKLEAGCFPENAEV